MSLDALNYQNETSAPQKHIVIHSMSIVILECQTHPILSKVLLKTKIEQRTVFSYCTNVIQILQTFIYRLITVYLSLIILPNLSGESCQIKLWYYRKVL